MIIILSDFFQALGIGIIVIPLIIIGMFIFTYLPMFLFSKIFNVKIKSRSGTVVSTPDSLSELNKFAQDVKRHALNKIKDYSVYRYEKVTDKNTSKVEQLTQLGELRRMGIISEDELSILKREIIK